MSKQCIFDKMKCCSNCGECYACDLNSSKKCNNCGKCLEIEGYDIRAIQIEDIFENREELNEYEESSKLHDDLDQNVPGEETWDYIDDIREIADLIEDEEALKNFEEFPGFLNLAKDSE